MSSYNSILSIILYIFVFILSNKKNIIYYVQYHNFLFEWIKAGLFSNQGSIFNMIVKVILSSLVWIVISLG